MFLYNCINWSRFRHHKNGTIMKVEYFESVLKQNDCTTIDIEDVIKYMQDDKSKAFKEEILNAKSDHEQKELKKKLQAFRPCVELKSECFPNGIVYFDIDTKENIGTNFEKLRTEIQALPEVYFVYESPRNGLKIGLHTDFNRDEGEETTDVSERYKIAYDICEDYMHEAIGGEINFDANVRYLTAISSLSYDANPYLNHDCGKLNINEESRATYINTQELDKKKARNLTGSLEFNDIRDEVEMLLSKIPTKLGFIERRRVNFHVLNLLGDVGVHMLFNHWNKEDKKELKKQLYSQLKSASYGDINKLRSIAYGYDKTPTGKARKNLQPKEIQNPFPERYSVEDGMKIVEDKIEQFFKNKTSTFISSSTGSWKTRVVIDYIANKLSFDIKILILVPRHDLGEEMEKKFAALNRHPMGGMTVTHLYGRDKLCDDKNTLNKLKKYSASVPFAYCSNECPFRHNCEYLKQFNKTSIANVVIMTHAEYQNKESVWFNGYHEDRIGKFLDPKNNSWKPDYLVIDENILQYECYEDNGSYYESVKKIIASCVLGKTLEQAIKDHAALLEQDLKNIDKNGYPNFKNMQSYLAQFKNSKYVPEKFSYVLKLLNIFNETNNPEILNEITFDGKNLKITRLTKQHDRFKDVPALYLDATANEDITKTLLPTVDFCAVKFKSNDAVRIHQLSNTTITKNWLNDENHYQTLLVGLRKLLDGVTENVGLITYKNVGYTKDFYQKLSADLGITINGYFGGVKGSNKFEDVDILLIVGRQAIPQDEVKRFAKALFGINVESERRYEDRSLLMSDGRCYAINNFEYEDPHAQMIYESICKAETIQTIGRCRPIHGKAKNVYLFTNESFGDDVEISSFFEWGDFFQEGKSYVSTKAVEEIRKLKVLQFKNSCIAKILKVSNKVFSDQREKILEEIIAKTGLKHVICNGRFSNSNKWKKPRSYLVTNIEALKAYFDNSDETLLDYTLA